MGIRASRKANDGDIPDDLFISSEVLGKFYEGREERWSELEGAQVAHASDGDGDIVRVEQRLGYIPLIEIKFKGETQMYNSVGIRKRKLWIRAKKTLLEEIQDLALIEAEYGGASGEEEGANLAKSGVPESKPMNLEEVEEFLTATACITMVEETCIEDLAIEYLKSAKEGRGDPTKGRLCYGLSAPRDKDLDEGPISARVWGEKEENLFDELQSAISQTSGEEMAVWAKNTVARLFEVGKRRGKNLVYFVATVLDGSISELCRALAALLRGNLIEHLFNRSGAAINATSDFLDQNIRAIKHIGKSLLADPKKNAPEVLALALGFTLGSGGLDANGGGPDMDITLGGIGAHRSILTHSVLSGMVIETSVLALAELAGIVCDKLPAGQRSEFWDILSRTKDQIAEKFATGISAGIAYHLAVDATLQQAPYKDLPGPMPMGVHQTIMGTNAVVEGVDAMARPKTLMEMRKDSERVRKAREYWKNNAATKDLIDELRLNG
jgi:hypothetical protein